MIRLVTVLFIALALAARADDIIWPPPPPDSVPGVSHPRPDVTLAGFQQEVDAARRQPVDLIFDGDASVVGWKDGKEEGTRIDDWNQQNPHLKPFIFGGFGEWRTEYQLWDLQHGELAGLHPKLIVVAMGLQNLRDGDKPEDVAAAIRLALDLYRQKCPEAHIVLMGIFPFGGDQDSPQIRQAIQATNALLARFDDKATITFLNIDDKLAGAGGTPLSPNLPSYPTGFYSIWGEALQPLIDKYCPDAQASDPTPYATSISDPEPILKYPFARTPPPGVSRAVFPVPYPASRWFQSYDRVLLRLKRAKFEIAVDGGFLAASLVQAYWGDTGEMAWKGFLFSSDQAVNLAVPDTPASAAWRARHGQMDGQNPKLVILLSSTIPGDDQSRKVDDVAADIQAMVGAYENACPHAHIVLFGWMPHGAAPDDPERKWTDGVNALLAHAPADPRVTFLNLTSQMLNADGSLDDRYVDKWDVFKDPGVRLFATAIRPLVKQYCPDLK